MREVSQRPEELDESPLGPGCCWGACYRKLEAPWREDLAGRVKVPQSSRSPLPGRESLLLPYLKQEELPSLPRGEPPCLAFRFVLCAATSPAVKRQEEALTYLNQGMLGLGREGLVGRQALETGPRVGWCGRHHLCSKSGAHTSP